MAAVAKTPKLSYQRVLLDCRDSIKRLTKLEKVVPILRESQPGRARMPKKIGKGIIKGSGDTELLLGWVNLSMDNFVAFLEVLQSTSDEEGHRHLMKMLSVSLPSMMVESGSEMEAKVKKLLAATLHASEHMVDTVPTSLVPTLEHTVDSQTTRLTEALATSKVAEVATEVSHDETVLKHSDDDVDPSTSFQPQPEAQSQHSDSTPTGSIPSPLTASTVQVPAAVLADSTRAQDPFTTHTEQTISDLETGTSSQMSATCTAKSMQIESDTCSDTVVVMKPTAQQQQPVQPPPGFIGCLRESFTSNGGELYSPEYGITVSIPSSSVPPSTGHFLLTVYVYLKGPFTIPGDTELCTPVVWFNLEPSFTFVDDITIKFPHSAFIPSSVDLHQLSLWRAADLMGSTYDLSKKVEADFSDGYHVVALVRHFSPYCGTVSKKRRKKRRVSSKSKRRQPKSPLSTAQERRRALKRLQDGSSSVDSHSSVDSDDLSKQMDEQMMISVSASDISAEQPQSPDESTVGPAPALSTSHSSAVARQSNPDCLDRLATGTATNQFIVRKCVPRDRSVSSWEAVFYVCYHNTAGDKAIRLAAESRFGRDNYLLSNWKKFQFSSEDCLEFNPPEWTKDEWNVFVTDQNEIERDHIVQIDSDDGASRPGYPPEVTYAIQRCNPPSIPLRCKVEILGVQGHRLQYVLTSTSVAVPHPAISRPLSVSSCLYTKETQLLQFLAQAPQHHANLPGVILDLQAPDHQKLLAEISLQSNRPRDLSRALQLAEHEVHLADYPGDEAEQIYHVLATWACRNCPKATLQQLLQLMGRVELQFDNRRLCIDPHIENSTIIDRQFIVTISEKLQLRWKFVGRILGIPHVTVEGIEHDHRFDIKEQSYQMLEKW